MRRKAGLGGAWDDEDAAADEEAAEAADLFGFDLGDFGIPHVPNRKLLQNKKREKKNLVATK